MDRTERLVLGTADLRDDELTVSLLDRFHAAGGRRLDLANVYGDGEASRGARRWLAQSARRDDVVLYVKGCHPPFCSPSLVKVEVERARLHRVQHELPRERREVHRARLGRKRL